MIGINITRTRKHLPGHHVLQPSMVFLFISSVNLVVVTGMQIPPIHCLSVRVVVVAFIYSLNTN
jgi:hypothetical protein